MKPLVDRVARRRADGSVETERRIAGALLFGGKAHFANLQRSGFNPEGMICGQMRTAAREAWWWWCRHDYPHPAIPILVAWLGRATIDRIQAWAATSPITLSEILAAKDAGRHHAQIAGPPEPPHVTELRNQILRWHHAEPI